MCTYLGTKFVYAKCVSHTLHCFVGYSHRRCASIFFFIVAVDPHSMHKQICLETVDVNFLLCAEQFSTHKFHQIKFIKRTKRNTKENENRNCCVNSRKTCTYCWRENLRNSEWTNWLFVVGSLSWVPNAEHQHQCVRTWKHTTCSSEHHSAAQHALNRAPIFQAQESSNSTWVRRMYLF